VAAPQPRVGTFHRAGGSAFYRALGPLARWAANRLAVRCAVSAEAEATASEALGGEYLVVGNGVELDRYADAPPWPTEGPTILFIGRHEDRKGLAVLLQAFEDLPPDHPATLWIAGDGPERDVLERRHPAGPTRQWLGRIPDDELASRLRGADILCAPSLRGESFGVILLEAMAAGAALVASDLPGYAAVAGDHALLVPPGDTAALTAALADLIADASAGTGRCSSEALEAALDHAGRWSMTALAERYVEIYAQVVAG
jgi:phosphatidylinositol alpha-mannosyltransferase